MERTLIKNSFMGFAHRVAPLQNVFHRECCDADLNTDVLEFISGLQNELVGKMMDGACAISQHRRSKDVAAEDLLCHLDTQWNLDPLLMSANCIKTCYRVRETTDKIDLSSSQEPLPRKRRTRCSSYLPKVHPASSKVKKNSAKKSKLKSKCNQSIEILNCKSKVNTKSQDICPENPFKIHLPLFNKKPVLKAEKQLSIEMPGSDSFVEFLGKRYKLNICNVDVTEPSAIVPLNKHKSEAEKKISICERTLKIAGMKQDASVATPKSPEASKVDEQSSTYEHLIKDVPSKEKTEPKMKVPTSFCFDSEAHTFRITGLRQDISVTDAISKQSPEAPTCKPKSKVEKNKLTCKSSISLPFKEKTEPEFEVPTQVNFDTKPLAFSITGKKENFSKKFSDACMCKPKSNVEEKTLTYKHSAVFSLKEKTKSEIKLAKQTSVEMPCPDSKILKLPEKKGKQKISGVKCASVETQEDPRKHSVEMSHSGSDVHKISLKKRKRELYDINDVPVETPEEARRKLATVLLRIAGRY